ncbi:MAG: hypothetical protein O2967_21120 [Proteobacteria bacterium]|nr:hypothetical protein [Pseudomonadota bacterium]
MSTHARPRTHACLRVGAENGEKKAPTERFREIGGLSFFLKSDAVFPQRDQGYTLADMAAEMGRHYSGISKIIKTPEAGNSKKKT